MQKPPFSWTLTILTLSLFMTSCSDTAGPCPGSVDPPQVIALLITVNNRTSDSATVTIRHAWLFSEVAANWVAGASETVTVGPGERQRLDNETARYFDNVEYQEIRGFILWQESTAEQFEHLAGKSSFVLEIARGGNTTRLAGYKTVESGFAGTELCWLHINKIEEAAPDRTAKLWARGNGVYDVWRPYAIPATLTLNANGTYSFQFDEDMYWQPTAAR